MAQRRPASAPPVSLPTDNKTPQALILALLEAQSGSCDCKPCQLLRKAVTQFTAQVLDEVP